MAGERTEQATQHRREKARKEGDILHSRELAGAAGSLAGVMALGVVGSRIMATWRIAFAGFLALGAPARWETGTVAPTLIAIRRLTLSVLGPTAAVMAAVAAAAFGAGIAQTGGLNVYAGAVGFKLERINPAANVKSLFSLRAAARAWPSRSSRPVFLRSSPRSASPGSGSFRRSRSRASRAWARMCMDFC